MKSYLLIASASLLLAAPALAQNDGAQVWQTGVRHSYSLPQMEYRDPTVGSQIYESGNECGPDRAVPVWGPGNAMVGYACERESANGN